jgi:hypothetical protein
MDDVRAALQEIFRQVFDDPNLATQDPSGMWRRLI